MVTSFANILSHSVSCLFIWFLAPFAMEKLLSLIRFHLFVFAFVFHYSRGQIQKKILLRFMSKSVLPMFSSRSCIVSSLTFRSLIPFEFILSSITRKKLQRKKKKHMEAKQYATKQLVDHGRDKKHPKINENKNKFFQNRICSSKREVYSDTSLSQETRKISNNLKILPKS